MRAICISSQGVLPMSGIADSAGMEAAASLQKQPKTISSGRSLQDWLRWGYSGAGNAAACARPVAAGHLYFRDRHYPHGQWLRQAMPLSLHGGQQAGSGRCGNRSDKQHKCMETSKWK